MKSNTPNKMKSFIDIEGEVWIPIFRDYEISNMGRVASVKGRTKRLIKTYTNNRGYHLIHPRINNKRIVYTVHRLVAMIFVKTLDHKKVTVNHHFGKDDNRASSLSWMTYSENTRHGVSNGLLPKGSESYLAKLDEFQVKVIRSLRGELTQKQIGEYFKVSRGGTIGKIMLGQTWKHVA